MWHILITLWCKISSMKLDIPKILVNSESFNYSRVFLLQVDVFLFAKEHQRHHPAGNYTFKVNNRNTIARCEIYSKLAIKTLSLLLTLNIFHTLF